MFVGRQKRCHLTVLLVVLTGVVYLVGMKKIIFADDDPTIQDVMHLILDDDYEVISLLGGEKLLEDDFEIPDLFLLDRQLTSIDGLQICRRLKSGAATQNVPVIMISAAQNIVKLAKDAGADAVIEKPFQIRELRQLIAEHLK
jgi:DNA-binding response OmpR family regulator